MTNFNLRHTRWRLLVAIAVFGSTSNCASWQRKPVASRDSSPLVTVADTMCLLPAGVAEPEGWARDMMGVLSDHEIKPTLQAVCAVVAVVEQESGFDPNPTVANLASIIEARLDAYGAKLGPLGRPLLNTLLEARARPSEPNFATRLRNVKTERDLDRTFRDLLHYYENSFPKTVATLNTFGRVLAATSLEELNPITTAGSMQVSVRYAAELAEAKGIKSDTVREALYTRRGGLYYGVGRLLGYEAPYPEMIYRFADYNAGVYASRNASLQHQLSAINRQDLVFDGDFLSYDKRGRAQERVTQSWQAVLSFRSKHARDLTEWRIHQDLLSEKRKEFDRKDTVQRVRDVYAQLSHKKAAYARMPDVVIESPKMKQERTTRWFAEAVNRRYERCLNAFAGAPPVTSGERCKMSQRGKSLTANRP